MDIDLQPREPEPVDGTLRWLGFRLKKNLTGQIYGIVGELILSLPVLIPTFLFTDLAWAVIPAAMALAALNAGAIFEENNVEINYQSTLKGFGRDIETPEIPIMQSINASGNPLIRFGFLLFCGKCLYLVLLILMTAIVAPSTGAIGVILIAFLGEYTERWLNRRDKSLIIPGIKIGSRILDEFATTGRERMLNDTLSINAGFLLQTVVSGRLVR